MANAARTDDVLELLAHRRLGAWSRRDEDARLRREQRAAHGVWKDLVRSLAGVIRGEALQQVEPQGRDLRPRHATCVLERTDDGRRSGVTDDREALSR
jgi:hypothetical protein